MAKIAIHLDSWGFVPRSMRKPPVAIPEDQKWCWFCEELHDLEYFYGAECREYAVYRSVVYKMDPANRSRQRVVWRNNKRKNRMRDLIESTGCRVVDISYDGDDFDILISPKYLKKNPVRKRV